MIERFELTIPKWGWLAIEAILFVLYYSVGMAVCESLLWERRAR